MTTESKKVTVLGAGVIGLTTALKLQEKGYNVTIVGECRPGDEKSIRYTSPWAASSNLDPYTRRTRLIGTPSVQGAHHVSLAGNDLRQQKMDRETFDVMWRMSAPDSPTQHLFMRVPQTELYVDMPTGPSILDVMPDFKLTPPDTFPSPIYKDGYSFTTVTIDTPNYLLWLFETFTSTGGKYVRASVQHLQQILDGAFATGPPDAVVVCPGIGARTLGGVEDKDVHPIRGQTVLIRAPWVKFGKTASTLSGLWTYVIPRRSGNVILGGTKATDDWYPHPRSEITEDILQRVLEMAPEIAPPDIVAQRKPTVDDIRPLIIEEGCGLRPGRVGGIRLESAALSGTNGAAVPVVFNYGHGGYGYQSSWGSACMALELLEDALKGEFRAILPGSAEPTKGQTHH